MQDIILFFTEPFKTYSIPDFFWLIFFAGGFVAGFVDSVAGGGGLISVPILLASGLPPHLALGTNKLQSSFGSFSSTLNFIRKKQITIKESLTGILFTFLGAAAGTISVQALNADFLETIIPFLLLAILIYFTLNKSIGFHEKPAKIRKNAFFLIFGLLLGFYDGFFGPGTGNFWVLAIMILLGQNMVKATAYTKIMNFTSNITALFFFAVNGNIVLSIGLLMALGQFTGARVGSGMVVKKGAAFIRPLFITVVSLIIIHLMYKRFFS